MPSRDYSFLDIAVLDDVRSRFAAGDALAVLSIDLEEVIWANGAGAELFGFSDIEAVIGVDARLPLAARRQIMATPGYPEIGRDRPIGVRLASGMTSRMVGFLASRIALPGGETALLLAVPDAHSSSRGEREIGERILRGFGEAGHFVALVDDDGKVSASSDGFSGLGIAGETVAELAVEVSTEADRTVKRLIPTSRGRLPAGIARLADRPAMNLLVVIGDNAADDAETESDGASSAPVSIDTTDRRDRPAAATPGEAPAQDAPPTQPEEAVAPEPAGAAGESDHWYFNTSDGGSPDTVAAAAQPGTDSYSDSNAEGSAPSAEDYPTAPQADRPSAPVRFAWRTDAAGRFSEISPEFAGAVGEAAADVVGQSFADVAARLGLDPDGEIAGLLERRDTWSGRTVSWPVAGTDLRMPVDLAALPVYGRGRDFEGFRGFGVARVGDASVDPDRAGMSLGAIETPAESTAGADEQAGQSPASPNDATQARDNDPFAGEVPALSIVPKPERRNSDKIIRLAEHRQPANDKGLSPLERNAFREIGDRLKKDSETAEPDTPEEPAETVERVETTAETVAPLDKPATGTARSDADPRDKPEDDGDATSPGTAAHTQAAPASAFLPSAFATGRPGRAAVDTSILDKLPVPVLIHSGDVLHYANREFLEFTAYASIEELDGAGGLGVLFGDPYRDESENDRADRKLRLHRGDGLELPVEALLQSVPWNGGKALLLALRKVGRMPAAAAAPGFSSEERDELEGRIDELATIIDTATDGVVLIANDGTIRSISRPAEALFGVDTADLAGKPFTTLFAMESQRAARDYLNGLSENGVASVLNDGREVIGREAQGRFIPLFMTIGKLPNLGGYCAVVRDITQWKRAEEELTQSRAHAERASSQKTDFLARVSHEIRTPLNAIIGFSELMIDEKFGSIGNDRYRDYLRDINRSGNHVLDLVNDLLDISKIEAGEQEMSYEAVSLNDTLSEAVAMMQPQANRERVIIRSSFASRLPEIVADLRSIRQIALNLLSNAVRYTQAGGQVIVSTAYEASGDIAMRVRDTGIGMSPAEIEQALKPFKQINALKRGRGDGTGLGLPLTKAMVEANRARFTINSTPGEGTLVEITFPSTRVLAD
jgi:PAS domain S-box-containing protein